MKYNHRSSRASASPLLLFLVLNNYTEARRTMTRHTLFAVDFGGKLDDLSPPCGQEAAQRRCGRGEVLIELEERALLIAQISKLGAR